MTKLYDGEIGGDEPTLSSEAKFIRFKRKARESQLKPIPKEKTKFLEMMFESFDDGEACGIEFIEECYLVPLREQGYDTLKFDEMYKERINALSVKHYEDKF